MIIKIHRTHESKIVALCDEDLVGREIEDGNLHLNLGSDFYKGEKKSEDEIKKHLESARIINAVGKASVGLCVKLGKASEKDAVYIGKIPHVQVLLF